MATFLRSGFGSWPNPNATWIPFAPKVDGQFQVSTARNVAMTPPGSTTEAPGPYFQKEFFHNGYAKSLKQIVHFLRGMCFRSGSRRDTVRKERRQKWIAGRCPRSPTTSA